MKSPLAGLVGILVLCAVVLGIALPFVSMTSTDAGVVTIVRNGGWFDDKQIRQVDGKPQVLPAGSSLTWVGAFSTTHSYPNTQRYFKVSSRPDADSNEVINVPTKDGMSVGVEGTFYFDLNTEPAVLAQFDDRYGTRTYPSPTTADPSRQLHAWESGDEGWRAFLAGSLGNLVQNDLRREIGKINCADLISSCALVQNTAGQDPAAVAAALAAAQSATADPAAKDQITKIQDSVNQSFTKDVTTDLGGPYFTNVRFVMSKVTLPDNVQVKINDAQAAFADVTKAAAAKQTAAITADTQAEKQRGYNLCTSCARQDELRSLPPNLTTYVESGGTGVAIAAK